MAEAGLELIAEVRTASRALVRELGFLERGLAGTGLSASAVRAIVELGTGQGLTATDLGERLALEKSTVSRLVRALLARGELRDRPDASDGRVRRLTLTPRGRQTWAAITRFAERRVGGALAELSADDQLAILRGLRTYAEALSGGRNAEGPRIRQGYGPGVLGRIVAWHGAFHVGLGPTFEARVAAEIADFAGRLGRDGNGLWWVDSGGQPVASIAIDGEDPGKGCAHLRWFFVTEGWRGLGLGERLLCEALAFCDARAFARTELRTLSGLNAARPLLERHGFVLTEEREAENRGSPAIENWFTRTRPDQVPRGLARRVGSAPAGSSGQG